MTNAWGGMTFRHLRQMPFDQHEFDMLSKNFFGLKESNINTVKIASVKGRLGMNEAADDQLLTCAAEAIVTPGLAAELYR